MLKRFIQAVTEFWWGLMILLVDLTATAYVLQLGFEIANHILKNINRATDSDIVHFSYDVKFSAKEKSLILYHSDCLWSILLNMILQISQSISNLPDWETMYSHVDGKQLLHQSTDIQFCRSLSLVVKKHCKVKSWPNILTVQFWRTACCQTI